MNREIWIKLKKGKSSKYFTLYTKDTDLAREMQLLPRRSGKYFYRNRSAKQLMKSIFGYTPEVERRRYAYVRMMRSYPPVAERMARFEKSPKELLLQMEADMGWNSETKDWNGYSEWIEKKEAEKLEKWEAKFKDLGGPP